MNQYLEISLRAFIGPERNDWSKYLDALALSYNSSPHTTTGFSPAYLLRGFMPITGATIIHSSEAIPQIFQQDNVSDKSALRPEASKMVELFQAECHRA